MTDIVQLLQHTYHLADVPDTHPIRRACAEILRLREEAERMRQIAVEARAALDAAPVERGDYVMVPREPTQEMVAATWHLSAIDFRVDSIYRAMIAARPAPVERAEPVARVHVHRTGGNPGIAWNAVAVDATESLPPLPDGTLLYTAPQPDALRDAAKQALEVLDEARTYVGSESWSPSMLQECNEAIHKLRAALGETK